MYAVNPNDGTSARGLTGGTLGDFHDEGPEYAFERVAATKDSLIQITNHSYGEWFRLVGGQLTPPMDSASGFANWDVLAGTADSLFFYSLDGVQATATLSGGAYAYVGSGDFGIGWKIIVGGK
jgi:hypothetical protein